MQGRGFEPRRTWYVVVDLVRYSIYTSVSRLASVEPYVISRDFFFFTDRPNDASCQIFQCAILSFFSETVRRCIQGFAGKVTEKCVKVKRWPASPPRDVAVIR